MRFEDDYSADDQFSQKLSDALNNELEKQGVSVSEALFTRTLAAIKQDAAESGIKVCEEQAGQDDLTGQSELFATRTENGRRKNRITRLVWSIGSIAAVFIIFVIGYQVFLTQVLHKSSEDNFTLSAERTPTVDKDGLDGSAAQKDSVMAKGSDTGNLNVFAIGEGENTAQAEDMTPEQNKISESSANQGQNFMSDATDLPIWMCNFEVPNAADANKQTESPLDVMKTAMNVIGSTEVLTDASLNYAVASSENEAWLVKPVNVDELFSIFSMTEKTLIAEEIEDRDVLYRILCVRKEDGDVVYYRVSGDAFDVSTWNDDGEQSEIVVYEAGDNEAFHEEVEMWLDYFSSVISIE